MTAVRKLLILIALVLIAAIGWGAVAHATTGPSGQDRGIILFVGDSNITLSSEQIDWALSWTGGHHDRPYIPVLASTVGASLRDDPHGDFWQTRLSLILARVHPSAVVVDLGINDTAFPGTPTSRGYAAYGTKVAWLLSLLPGVPVLWTNLPCRIEPVDRQAGCAAVNAALAQAPGLTVVNWSGRASSHPAWIDSAGEGVHLTTVGQTAYAGLVVGALDRKFS